MIRIRKDASGQGDCLEQYILEIGTWEKLQESFFLLWAILQKSDRTGIRLSRLDSLHLCAKQEHYAKAK